MADTAFFKTTAFGGFDKKSVLTYIDTLNEGFHTTELQYKEKLSAFAQAQESQVAHIRGLEAQLAEQSSKLEAVARQLELERGQTAENGGELEQLRERNKELETAISAAEREVKIQTERGRQLQFKAESLDYKSKKYDELSNQIGDTLIEAKRDAERIISEAQMQARAVSDRSKSYMKNFYSELSSFEGDAGRLRKSIEEILFVLNDRVDVMQEVVREISQRFDPGNAPLKYTEEAEPFPKTEDQAGYFGGVKHDDLAD